MVLKPYSLKIFLGVVSLQFSWPKLWELVTSLEFAAARMKPL